MPTLSRTRMSSKGQVVIPRSVRTSMGLRPGEEFVVLARDDAVILKVIKPPSMADLDRLIAKTRREARRVRLTKSDVAAIVADVRAGK